MIINTREIFKAVPELRKISWMLVKWANQELGLITRLCQSEMGRKRVL